MVVVVEGPGWRDIWWFDFARTFLQIRHSLPSSEKSNSTFKNPEKEDQGQEQIQGGHSALLRHDVFEEQNHSDHPPLHGVWRPRREHPALLPGEPADAGRLQGEVGGDDDDLPGGRLDPGLLCVWLPGPPEVAGLQDRPAVSVSGLTPGLWPQYSGPDLGQGWETTATVWPLINSNCPGILRLRHLRLGLRHLHRRLQLHPQDVRLPESESQELCQGLGIRSVLPGSPKHVWDPARRIHQYRWGWSSDKNFDSFGTSDFNFNIIICVSGWGSKAGYYFSASCVLLGSLTLCLIDRHNHNLRRRRRLRKMRSRASEASESCPDHQLEKASAERDPVERLESVCEEVRQRPEQEMTPANSLEDLDDEDILKNLPELSHFSEEGIADMDIPDDILDELEYLDILHDNITSCDGVRLGFINFFIQLNLIPWLSALVLKDRTNLLIFPPGRWRTTSCWASTSRTSSRRRRAPPGQGWGGGPGNGPSSDRPAICSRPMTGLERQEDETCLCSGQAGEWTPSWRTRGGGEHEDH